MKPLAGQPLYWRRTLRWRIANVSQETVDIVHQTFVDTYRETIATNAAAHPWWAEHPAAYPTVIDPY